MSNAEPAHFFAEAGYPAEQFQTAWQLATTPEIGKLSVSVNLQTNNTDISGYEAILDITESEEFESTSWPIIGFGIMRNEKIEVSKA